MLLKDLTLDHYDQMLALMGATAGIGLREADSRPGIGRFLARNPGLSVAASTTDGQLVGGVLCGHDGRRGYLHHMVIDPAYRRQGLGRQMIERCIKRLEAVHIFKIQLFIYPDNEIGQAFWRSLGWRRRDDILMFSRTADGRPNA